MGCVEDVRPLGGNVSLRHDDRKFVWYHEDQHHCHCMWGYPLVIAAEPLMIFQIRSYTGGQLSKLATLQAREEFIDGICEKWV